jgi:hypothetical protein
MSYCLFICFCISEKLFNHNLTLEYRGRRGRGRMAVGFTTTYAISGYHN